jgi:hypothetical protein
VLDAWVLLAFGFLFHYRGFPEQKQVFGRKCNFYNRDGVFVLFCLYLKVSSLLGR